MPHMQELYDRSRIACLSLDPELVSGNAKELFEPEDIAIEPRRPVEVCARQPQMTKSNDLHLAFFLATMRTWRPIFSRHRNGGAGQMRDSFQAHLRGMGRIRSSSTGKLVLVQMTSNPAASTSRRRLHGLK